jgi:hypothetical protein
MKSKSTIKSLVSLIIIGILLLSATPVFAAPLMVNDVTLLTPADGTRLAVGTTSLALDWEDVVGTVVTYEVQVATNAAFTKMFKSATVAESTYNIATLPTKSRTYYWRVRATVDGVVGDWSAGWTFTTPNPLKKPVPRLPKNAAWVDLAPTLTWRANPAGVRPAYYKIQIAKDTLFTAPFEDQTPNRTPSYAVTNAAGLVENTVYYWRVQACNAFDECGPYGPMRRFRTLPPPPTLVSPANASTAASLTPTFEWTDASAYGVYQIQVTSKSNMKGGLAKVSATTFTPAEALKPNTLYYWRVRPTVPGKKFSSIWSEVWTFTTPAAP